MECKGCGATVAPEKDFCLECGADPSTGKPAVAAELLARGPRVKQRPAGRLALAAGALTLAAVAAAAVAGIRSLPAAPDKPLPYVPARNRMFEGIGGGKLVVRLAGWTPTGRLGQYQASLDATQQGLGAVDLVPGEFVVVDPKGGHIPPQTSAAPVTLARGQSKVVKLTYQLPSIQGRYELAWIRSGRRIGGWTVACVRCDGG